MCQEFGFFHRSPNMDKAKSDYSGTFAIIDMFRVGDKKDDHSGTGLYGN
jgi:hypothetical protein